MTTDGGDDKRWLELEMSDASIRIIPTALEMSDMEILRGEVIIMKGRLEQLGDRQKQHQLEGNVGEQEEEVVKG